MATLRFAASSERADTLAERIERVKPSASYSGFMYEEPRKREEYESCSKPNAAFPGGGRSNGGGRRR